MEPLYIKEDIYLLSYKKLDTSKVKIHHVETGMKPDKDLRYSQTPYLRNGIKVARLYIDGIGVLERHAIYHLR